MFSLARLTQPTAGLLCLSLATFLSSLYKHALNPLKATPVCPLLLLSPLFSLCSIHCVCSSIPKLILPSQGFLNYRSLPIIATSNVLIKILKPILESLPILLPSSLRHPACSVAGDDFMS